MITGENIDRRALKETSILFNDNGDERRKMYVSSMQISAPDVAGADDMPMQFSSCFTMRPCHIVRSSGR